MNTDVTSWLLGTAIPEFSPVILSDDFKFFQMISNFFGHGSWVPYFLQLLYQPFSGGIIMYVISSFLFLYLAVCLIKLYFVAFLPDGAKRGSED